MATTIKSTAQTDQTATATFAGHVYAGSMTLNGGETVDMFQRYQTSQNFGTIAGNATVTATFTATGITTNALVFGSIPSTVDDVLSLTGKATAADTIEIAVHNTSNNNATAPTATYDFLAVQFS